VPERYCGYVVDPWGYVTDDMKWIAFSHLLFMLLIGAYQIGDTASYVDNSLLFYIVANEVHVRYDDMGSELVKRSVALEQPMIFVSFNYR
jgi:hypothetical protein